MCSSCPSYTYHLLPQGASSALIILAVTSRAHAWAHRRVRCGKLSTIIHIGHVVVKCGETILRAPLHKRIIARHFCTPPTPYPCHKPLHARAQPKVAHTKKFFPHRRFPTPKRPSCSLGVHTRWLHDEYIRCGRMLSSRQMLAISPPFFSAHATILAVCLHRGGRVRALRQLLRG